MVGRRSTVGMGAQRLSASQRWACDRPRCSADSRRCAQRLSASQRWACRADRAAHRPNSAGAQRLSASQRWAYSAGRRRAQIRVQVLNAFRHHRGGHASLPRATGMRRRVLNAFRHHRGGHRASARSTTAIVIECSTPFGITEVGIARAGSSTCAVHRVLNAFRHHRGGHRIARAVDASRPAGAQRLSASQRWACRHRSAADQAIHGCSTPFGITEVGIASTLGASTAS